MDDYSLDERLPWYRDTQLDPPFRLKTCFKNLRGWELRFVSLFPWSLDSLHSFGDSYHSHIGNDWPAFIETYAGSMVIGTTEDLYLIKTPQSNGKQKKQIRLDVEARPITAVAWALSGSFPLDPLLVIAMSGILCVYNVQHGEPVGFLRGHGGSITSIAVHPRLPFYVCTTSSDQTARIYDLDRLPDAPPTNPFWRTEAGPSKGGAPHGLRPSEREEWGKGQCIAILAGGRSGGHLATLTCAAFHPTFPLIATGGMDRVVKIWRVHDYKGGLHREDKPLYSSTLVHRSSAASVVWELPGEHSIEDEPEYPELEWVGCPGRIVILRWLGLNRFFPPAETKYQGLQRGCASDYQESSSFTVIASIPLPYYPHTPHLRVFEDVYHDHIILVAHQKAIHLLNTSCVPGLETTEFPTDPKQFPLTFMTQSRLRAEENIDVKLLRNNNWTALYMSDF
ncbi:WD40-repeat-containing domain protein [Multifurca ochricompacta]|uniref:WD40-repeat-containing domain protein n=1 Tax=Multifurca ochricompacta TaxID=376703 RepID=A0AAD4MD60_9AGAM|nr:WD40-repeat-containing domain protein [Multifurca ochricompacta]